MHELAKKVAELEKRVEVLEKALTAPAAGGVRPMDDPPPSEHPGGPHNG